CSVAQDVITRAQHVALHAPRRTHAEASARSRQQEGPLVTALCLSGTDVPGARRGSAARHQCPSALKRATVSWASSIDFTYSVGKSARPERNIARLMTFNAARMGIEALM